MNSADTTVFIYCDGACSPNPGTGGWGTILKWQDHAKELSGGCLETTNNRMELTAAIKGLEALNKPSRIVITTDSKYLADCFRQGWLKNWIRRGWKTAANKPVKNQDLWEELHALTQEHKITWQWIEGHAGHAENERCDELAVQARLQLQG